MKRSASGGFHQTGLWLPPTPVQTSRWNYGSPLRRDTSSQVAPFSKSNTTRDSLLRVTAHQSGQSLPTCNPSLLPDRLATSAVASAARAIAILKHRMQTLRHKRLFLRRAFCSLLSASTTTRSAMRQWLERIRSSSLISHFSNHPHRKSRPKTRPGKAKRPPGNRVASSLGRIVPTEAKPSELSGEILSLAK